jgi:hypothetical protein
MVDEFESYEYEITESGRYKFEAADGHDDKVSAKMLENWGIVNEPPPNVRTLESAPEPQVQKSIAEEYRPGDAAAPDPVADLMNRPGAWR